MFLPYAAEHKRTMVDVLIAQLTSGSWTCFKAAVAFARQSGNYRELLDALVAFACKGAQIELTFGANTFSDGEGSDYEAISTLLNVLAETPGVKLYLYNQRDRTFHPKVYLFSNTTSALLIVGSSNWTQGGLQRNIEANVLITLELSDPAQRAAYDQTVEMFKIYWSEIE